MVTFEVDKVHNCLRIFYTFTIGVVLFSVVFVMSWVFNRIHSKLIFLTFHKYVSISIMSLVTVGPGFICLPNQSWTWVECENVVNIGSLSSSLHMQVMYSVLCWCCRLKSDVVLCIKSSACTMLSFVSSVFINFCHFVLFMALPFFF